jgi:hypothetical protein
MDSAPVYEIRVRGRLDDRWAEWFSGVVISSEDGPDGGTTTLTGTIVDQAALRGILERIWDLNLTLISLNVVGARRPDTARRRPTWSI